MKYRIVEYADGRCKVKHKYSWWPFWLWARASYYDYSEVRVFKDKEAAKNVILDQIAEDGAKKIRNTVVSVEDYP